MRRSLPDASAIADIAGVALCCRRIPLSHHVSRRCHGTLGLAATILTGTGLAQPPLCRAGPVGMFERRPVASRRK